MKLFRKDYNDYIIIKQYNPECPERKVRYSLKYRKYYFGIKKYRNFILTDYGGTHIVYRDTKEELLKEYLEYVLRESDYKAYEVEKGDKKFF